MIARINPKIIKFSHNIQKLCTEPYYNHPKDCPNFNNKIGCPAGQYLIDRILDFNKPIYIVFSSFFLQKHIQKMEKKHPTWSERQLYCCLYWQATARKIHRKEIESLIIKFDKVVNAPEAHGVNLTKLMKHCGVELEWMPKYYAYQISLVGFGIKK